MRALLSGLSAGDLGRQAGRRGAGGGDDRPGRRGLIRLSKPVVARSIATKQSRWTAPGSEALIGQVAMSSDSKPGARTVVLVGCGQMGSAMLRGWLRGNAAGRFVVIEPAGMPPELSNNPAVAWNRGPEEVPADLAPEAVVFAVKPQVFDALLPAYRRWVRPETLFLSIAAGKTIAGIARHLGDGAAIIRCMPNTPAAIGARSPW